jgi:hypothetical protein
MKGNDGQIPNVRVVRVHEYGLHSWRGKSAYITKRLREPSPPPPTGHVQGVIADSSGQQFQVLSKGLLQLKSAMRQQQADVEALSHTERTGASGGEDGEAGSMESHAPAAAAAAAAEDPWLTERDAEGGAITYSFDAEEGGLSDSKQQKPGYKM